VVVFDNPIGVLTNPPSFDWQQTNLRNYINLTAVNVSPCTIAGLERAPFGQGSGLVGLSGDFTPPSRFLRAATYVATALPADTAAKGVLQAFHILNQFDIPVGAAREVADGVIHSDFTQCTTVHDPQALKYYFRTYDDQNIKMVDLKLLDLDANTLKKVNLESPQPITDISKSLQ